MDESNASEKVERQALTGWHESVQRAGLAGYDWRLVEIGDALCSVSSSEPSILINRVLGLGSQATPSVGQLAEIRNLYRDAGVQRFFLHVTPGIKDEQLVENLSVAGYEKYRGWMKFSRGPDPIPPARSDLEVRRIGAEHATEFAAIVAPAFDMTPACEPAIAALVLDNNWQLFMSFDGDDPAGTGAMYLRDDVAYMDFGATHPDFRCRGSQSAVLAARMQAALDAGCKKFVTMTGEEVPGDPQHSYSNILKRGFEEAYLRENWIPVDETS